MAHRPVHRQAVDLILAAMFKRSDTGFPHGFMFPAGPGRHDFGGGEKVFWDPAAEVRAALHLRSNGAPHLRHSSVAEVRSAIKSFLTAHYYVLAPETFLVRFEGPFSGVVSEAAKDRIAEMIAESELFSPSESLTLFPLVAVRVSETFQGEQFVFSAAKRSLDFDLPGGFTDRQVLGGQFPPIEDRGSRRMPVSWLAVRSQSVSSAKKIRSAILGAVALVCDDTIRHMFSGRTDLFGGHCTLGTDRSASYSHGDPHTPPMMEDVQIGSSDFSWLERTSQLLSDARVEARRRVKALEYFYRAWPQDETERFPTLCVALDAVLGDASHATQAVVSGVQAAIGGHVNAERLRDLMELRASVIHGGAPDVYDSRKYGRYYARYGCDPIRDMELVVCRTIAHLTFGDGWRQHDHPNAGLLSRFQAEGKLPKNIRQPSILDAQASLSASA